ncbi:MAG: acyltransferase [Marinobacter sp.]|uniref:acyltransferase n=1 Tax=Marinobacter sp. TaxID=50741 RepID=UPI001B70C09B|nr:acyltransferase [Marinobacter sp.]MBQ0746691.1 acyltransferase [Marinobacter sp.]MBQ0816112.1 acyltransferase [Marinobacter sp.]|tara:strand:- start:2802 stop:3716 length:915 start_codon:yes stop_codon:yes gene_type:complete
MLYFLPAPLKGTLAALSVLVNTLVLFPFLMLFALLKLVLPVIAIRKGCTVVLNNIARLWIGVNNLVMDVLHQVDWDVRGAEHLSREHWYFVTCNHQSWADIPAIQYVLNSRIPLLKFFLKKQLIWVPLLGVAWWALDFPFMHRHTKEQLARQPELKGKDIAATQAACEKFRYTPVTIFNFMEGTRFTLAKHKRQNSPYKHLLKPRAGGTAFVLGAMGEMLHTMLDVTIVYPGEHRSIGIWDYLSGRIRTIVIDIRVREIPTQFLGMDYENGRETRVEFQRWVSGLWAEKDARIEAIKNENRAQA